MAWPQAVSNLSLKISLSHPSFTDEYGDFLASCCHDRRNSEPIARAAAGCPSNGAVAGELKTCALPYGCL
ncbi:hypothetical protein PIB30_090034 [Stylosanthes scabra]|uniref:Uncharacterized protein n=1 Tax=Stylosanthes scabra TaxID=79078 RepID=A0ABU6RV68_9FABA|nr:hypothetical protein [Stylosanthes scabra]